MPQVDGFALLAAVKAHARETEVVVMTAYATVPDAVAAVKRGAYDYIGKPFDPDEVSLVAARAVEHGRARREGRVEEEPVAATLPSPLLAVPFRQAVEAERERASRAYLVALMREFRGCVTWAADHAGMERESLHRVLKQFGIRSEQFKPAHAEVGGPSRAR
jgi:DNA-binding NtrC family response regulator